MGGWVSGWVGGWVEAMMGGSSMPYECITAIMEELSDVKRFILF